MPLIAAVAGVLALVSACGGTAAGASSAHLSHQDRRWINAAHEANMAEIGAGGLAQRDGGNRAVRTAGAVLVRDHKALDDALIRVTTAMKLRLPTSPTVWQVKVGDRLSQERAYRFDRDFTASMLVADKNMIVATRYEIAHGSAPRVVRLARQALPVLLKHLRLLRKADLASIG